MMMKSLLVGAGSVCLGYKMKFIRKVEIEQGIIYWRGKKVGNWFRGRFTWSFVSEN